MSTPDSSSLKSYYTVDQVKEQMQGRDIAAEATTISREPLATGLASCPVLVPIKGGGWESPGGIKRMIPLSPNVEKSKN